MTPNTESISVKKLRPFPWLCGRCMQQAVHPVTIRHATKVKHDGRLHDIVIPEFRIPQCGNCQELIFTDDADEQILVALRAHLKLLTPQEIQARRSQLELEQAELAERIGVEEEMISRWETGAMIQSRAMDNLLRLCLDCPHAREFLLALKQ